ncbi:MAG: hypothetical protein HUJ26_04335 [Planctomycetaceae bacterium]|nr:hypothetical protein [Planctomycetaceae bacterium]
MLFDVYNLEFPEGRDELIFGDFHFIKQPDYREKYKCLSHYSDHTGSYSAQKNSGSHQMTAQLHCDESFSKSVLFHPDIEYGILHDLIVLLSIFTSRDIALSLHDDSSNTEPLLFNDPRYFRWGGILATSIPYAEAGGSEEEYLSINVGFEQEVSRIFQLIQDDNWKERYRKGHYLRLCKSMIAQITVETAFIQSWTIWEHLFSVLNDSWLSNKALRNTKAVEKIAFLLTNYAFKHRLGEKDHRRLNELAGIRNRLIHYGMFPDTDSVIDDAKMFIRMTEFLVARTLELEPSNLFNTVEKFEEFLNRQQQKSNQKNQILT